ncbi:MAG: neutral/alkaline non-lysosomal ceramidase N-terminal domain-containing protein [Terriglobia bacterium]
MANDPEVNRRGFLKTGFAGATGLASLGGILGVNRLLSETTEGVHVSRTRQAQAYVQSGNTRATEGGGPTGVLKAGVAKVDITPPVGTMMWGYFERLTPAKSVLDPLFARVLVLEAGDRRWALVTLDLGRTFGPASLESLKKAIKQSSSISFLLTAASHTHAGPVVMDEDPNGTPAWETTALERIAKAVDEACARLVEARLGADYGTVDIGYNRRRVNPDGTVTMFWSNPTKVPTAPVDPTVSVLRVDAADGQPLAVLVNYACHAVIFGADNLQFSADYPGVMAEVVERDMDGRPLCFFLQGAAGDINPYFTGTTVQDGAVKMRDWTGQRLGEEAARVANAIRTQRDPSSSIAVVNDTLTFDLRWNPRRFHQALLLAYGPTVFQHFAPQITGELQFPVSTVLLNNRIAWMTMPGEPFVDFQINWRDRCPVRDAFFLGYANGYSGYIPTILTATQGGYGTANSTTWVEVGAGERMVDHALVRTYEMMGRLTDAPEELLKGHAD